MKVTMNGFEGWVDVPLPSNTTPAPVPVIQLATEPTFKKGDAVLLELPQGSGIGWITNVCGDTYRVCLHDRYQTERQLPYQHYEVEANQLTKLNPFPIQVQPSEETKSDDKGSLATFLNTCSNNELIQFVKATRDFGSMNIVRKAIKAWVALAKEA